MPNNELINLTKSIGALSSTTSESFSFERIILSIIISFSGIMILKWGKQKRHIPYVFIGIILISFSYFTPSIEWDIGITILLWLATYFFRT